MYKVLYTVYTVLYTVYKVLYSVQKVLYTVYRRCVSPVCIISRQPVVPGPWMLDTRVTSIKSPAPLYVDSHQIEASSPPHRLEQVVPQVSNEERVPAHGALSGQAPAEGSLV